MQNLERHKCFSKLGKVKVLKFKYVKGKDVDYYKSFTHMTVFESINYVVRIFSDDIFFIFSKYSSGSYSFRPSSNIEHLVSESNSLELLLPQFCKCLNQVDTSKNNIR